MSKSRTRRNGEGTIRQRTDGRWEVRISGGIDFATGHKMRVSRYASTEEEAVQALNQLRVQFGSSRRKVSPMLLGEWLDFWLQTYMISSLKQSTYASYQTYARVHFKPALGEVPLKSLSTRILQQFYNYKFEEEGLSPKSIRNMNLYLHKALSQALQEGLIDSNPASGVTLPRARRPQVEILTRDDQAKLVRATYHHRYGVFVRLVLMTGLRMGELLGLRWEDIDFHSNMLHIQRTLNRLQKRDLPDTFSGNRTEIVIQEPKTENSIRTIPLLPQLIKDLMTWRSLQEMDRAAAGEQYQDTGMIVTNPMGGYIEPRTFKKYYDQILEIARLRHFTFHALRHPYVKHTTKIFSLRLMDFQAQAYPDARRKTRGACQLHRGGQSRSPVRPLCNRKRFSCLPPQAKMSWILYAISMRLSGYTSTRSISSSASSVVSVSASKIALDASMRLSCRACSSCFCFACANTAA